MKKRIVGFILIGFAVLLLGVSMTQNQKVNATDEHLILVKGDTYVTSSMEYYQYAGEPIGGGGPIINYWFRTTSGCGFIYVQEGDLVWIGKLYVIEKITSDTVDLRLAKTQEESK